MQPQPLAKVERVNGVVLNAREFATRHSGLWVEASKFVGTKPQPRTILPAAIQALVPRYSARSAQIDPPFNSDLFEGL